MQVEFKIMTKESIAVNQKHEKKVIEAIKDGTITSSHWLVQFLKALSV